MFVRVYAGEDGQSHFEDSELPDKDLDPVALKPGAEIFFRHFADGEFHDWHNESPPIRLHSLRRGPVSSRGRFGAEPGTRRSVLGGRPDRPGPHVKNGERTLCGGLHTST